ncbi:hypothetical protein FGG78_20975 [Thioclava sp. BHET1]|nr:hypothetical protein FGG78_20975 [Thioclava sp. BHET1]
MGAFLTTWSIIKGSAFARGALAVLAALAMLASAAWWVDHRAYDQGYAAKAAEDAKRIATLQTDLAAQAAETKAKADQLAVAEINNSVSLQGFSDAVAKDPVASGAVPRAVDLRDLDALWKAARAASGSAAGR